MWMSGGMSVKSSVHEAYITLNREIRGGGEWEVVGWEWVRGVRILRYRRAERYNRYNGRFR